MYWMRGPAGVGKPTIAQTRAEKMTISGLHSSLHRNPLRLFTTIAYQLTTTLPDYRGAVEDRIFKDNTIVEKKMSSQLKSLIVEPLQELRKQGKSIQPKAIFINGLDECVGEDARAEIIKIIASSNQGRIHSVSLGHLQSRWTSHCVDIQAGQHCFSHSLHWTPYLSRGRRRDLDVSAGLIQGHTWTQRFPAIAIIMANRQQYKETQWYSRRPVCTSCRCPASCCLSTRPTIPRKTPICPRLPLRYETTGIYITLFAARCSLRPHREADSREHSSVGTIASFLSFVLGYRQSFVCLHALLLVKDLRVYA